MGYTAAVITVSDLGSRGQRVDTSGPAVVRMLEEAGYRVVHTQIVPDEQAEISAVLKKCADELHADLIVTTGGTGLSPRDVTPEATLAVLEREIRAIPVAMWVEGLKVTPRAMLSLRSRGYERNEPDRKSAGVGEGGTGKPRRGPARAGARAAHDRGRGTRKIRIKQRPPEHSEGRCVYSEGDLRSLCMSAGAGAAHSSASSGSRTLHCAKRVSREDVTNTTCAGMSVMTSCMESMTVMTCVGSSVRM